MDNNEGQATPTRTELYFVYQSLESRRATYDSMVWQTTAISLAAQSFLLTLALGRDSRSSVRVIAAVLSFMISLMTMQLMAKHRWGEILDSQLLENLERRLGFFEVFSVLPHDKLGGRIPLNISVENAKRLRSTWVRSKSSYRIWQFGLSLFGMTSLGIVVAVMVGYATSAFGK